MAKSSEKPKFSLRLLIDEEKNRVVLAEAGKDFVDVLCGLLTLPMGTIVRLLEKHQNPQSSIVGCFHNLYRSVSAMNVDNFQTQACKDLLLYPKSLKEAHCRRLKLNVDDAEATKFFLCPKFWSTESCAMVYSNFSNLKCRCGDLMSKEFQVQGEQTGACIGNEVDGVFLSCRTSFIITDDLKVALNSMGHVLNVLHDLGYAGFENLQEMLIDVGLEEVMSLLGCFFTSEAPLTDTFLRKHCMTRKRKMLTPLVQESVISGKADQLLTLKVFVRKLDKTILYAECREDFIDFLFSFLAIPLEFAWELSVDAANLGCIENLCRTVKGLSFNKQGEATSSKRMLPHYYSFRAQLLDIILQEPPEYECFIPRNSSCYKFARNFKKDTLSDGKILKFTTVDPKSRFGSSFSDGPGFVKGETNFIVSDDLFVTPMKSASTISLLSNLKMNISDIEEQVISIGKAEAVSLLRASLITTSALTNGLSNFLSNMKPEEAIQSASKLQKSENPL